MTLTLMQKWVDGVPILTASDLYVLRTDTVRCVSIHHTKNFSSLLERDFSFQTKIITPCPRKKGREKSYIINKIKKKNCTVAADLSQKSLRKRPAQPPVRPISTGLPTAFGFAPSHSLLICFSPSLSLPLSFSLLFFFSSILLFPPYSLPHLFVFFIYPLFAPRLVYIRRRILSACTSGKVLENKNSFHPKIGLVLPIPSRIFPSFPRS